MKKPLSLTTGYENLEQQNGNSTKSIPSNVKVPEVVSSALPSHYSPETPTLPIQDSLQVDHEVIFIPPLYKSKILDALAIPDEVLGNKRIDITTRIEITTTISRA